nr:flavodoxin domain-containing protein [Maliibacterium massiliense]
MKTRNICVVYQSKYGATQRYAQYLAGALGADMLSCRDASASTLAPYDTLLYGGGIYAGGIAGLKRFKKTLRALASPRLVLFACGASLPQAETVAAIRRQNCADLPGDTPIFYLRGAICPQKMRSADKLMMRMLMRMLQKKPPEQLEPWARDALTLGMDTDADWVDPQNIAPIVAWVKAP